MSARFPNLTTLEWLQRAARATAAGSARRTVIAATIGNVLEWYDFLVFGFLSLTIAKVFFPGGSELGALLMSAATFGVGLVARPVGAFVLGRYADRAGRKAALSATILLMAVGTCLIAAAPTFEVAGWWAPGIVVAARLVQGFSCGGELGGATAILAESAPQGRRGLYASWQSASQLCAFLLGSLVNFLVASSMSPAQIESGGWRLPFLIGLLIVPIGLFIRLRLDESPVFLRMRAAAPRARVPLRSVLTATAVAALYVAAPYALMLYMPIFAVRQLHMPMPQALMASVVAALVSLAFCPFAGACSDRVGRRPLMLAAALALGAVAYPALVLLTRSPDLATLIAIQTMFGLLTVAYSAPANATLSECFPTRVRSASMAVVYNVVAALVGGFAQFIIIWLTAVTGDPAAAAFYVLGAAIISAAGAWTMRDGFREELP